MPQDLLIGSLSVEQDIVEAMRSSLVTYTLLRVAAFHRMPRAVRCMHDHFPSAGWVEASPCSLADELGTSKSALCRELKPLAKRGTVALVSQLIDRRRHQYCFPGVGADDFLEPNLLGSPLGAQLAALVCSYLLTISQPYARPA